MVPRQCVAAGVWRGWEDLKLTHPSLLSAQCSFWRLLASFLFVQSRCSVSSILFLFSSVRTITPSVTNCADLLLAFTTVKSLSPGRCTCLSTPTYAHTATWVKIARKIKEREKEGGRVLLSKEKRSLPLLTKLHIDLKSCKHRFLQTDNQRDCVSK